MITILLQKIIDILLSSFTSIKSKLTTLYNNIDISSGGNLTDDCWNGEKVDDTYLDTANGELLPYGGWSTTSFIDLGESTKLYRCGKFSLVNYNCFYNSNKEYISSFGSGSITNIPNNAKYCRLSGVTGDLDGKIIIEV